MSGHPASVDLQRFAAGTLSARNSFLVVAHLVRGCRSCSLELLPMIEGRDDGAPSEYGDVTERYDRAIDRALRSAWRQETGAPRLRRAPIRLQVMIAVRGQRWSELTEAQRRRIRGLRKVEVLFAETRSLRHMDPQQMLHYAQLAQRATERLSPERHGRRTVADLKALTWSELANAYRIVARFDHAQDALCEAVLWCRRGSQDPLIQAEVATITAAFLADQRRFDESIDLLDQVIAICLSLGDDQDAGRALVQQGSYLGYDNKTRPALESISRGLTLLNQETDPAVFLMALHNLLWFMVDDGQHRAARIKLWKLRPLFLAQSSPQGRLRLKWLEARIYEGLGDLARAEAAFRGTREGLEGLGDIYSAALVGMDLAAMWLRQGRMDDVRELAESLIATFRALRIGREAVAVLLFLCKACEERRATVAITQDVVMILMGLERQPVPLPAPDPARD